MENVRIEKYLGIFTVVFISVIVLAISVVYLLDVDPGSGIGLIEVFVATYFTVMLFVRDNKRLPTPEERQKLVWLSFIVSLLIFIIPVICFLAYLGFSYGLADLLQGITEFMPKLSIFSWVMIVAAAIILSYLSVFLGYWFSTNKLGKYFLKQYVL